MLATFIASLLGVAVLWTVAWYIMKAIEQEYPDETTSQYCPTNISSLPKFHPSVYAEIVEQVREKGASISDTEGAVVRLELYNGTIEYAKLYDKGTRYFSYTVVVEPSHIAKATLV